MRFKIQPILIKDEKIMKTNFLKAAIFYEDLSQEIVSEVPVYTGYQFVGDVGGMLGLWIGVSALGIVQLIEFVLATTYTKARTKHTMLNDELVTLCQTQITETWF
ncbi:hypothetical protein LSH36_782g01016 [Paralvinella palmiformis]|uniref:Uncharacterized protein n=1 Tax=Paralvinella palmiformis TaxID=53620 RepID=A0AAD9MV48_9ANNE|nr:hypothetical protein LSH36_782g01016 [Paralvinella palmiformis]